jgi:hypothetical protein
MASGGLKKGNCFKLPDISGSYLPFALLEKDYRSSRHKAMVMQKSNIGHHNEIFKGTVA